MKPGRPVAHVTIAGRRLSAPECALAGLSVSLGRFSHDRAQLVVWSSSKFASAAAGSEMKLELGVEDDESDVWTGKVSAVYSSPDAILIEGLAATAALSGERKSQTYLNQSAADVVRDLASSVDVDDADASLQLEYYSVDANRTVWGHIIDLALLAGAETTTSASGGLRFVEVRPKPATRKFRFGADLLDWRVGPVSPASARSFAASGAASEAGKEKWHWLSQDSSVKPSRVVGGFQSQSAADALSQAAESRTKRASVKGVVRLVGASDLRVGDTFALDGAPVNDPGDLRAAAVAHHFSGTRGFWTDVMAEGAGGSGLGIGGLL